jgi:CDP-glucose 4,6-dehydratase
MMGAKVFGLALEPPTSPSLFTVAGVGNGMTCTKGDIRNFEVVRSVVSSCAPDIIIHMAAQPLVRLSYAEPIETYSTNVMGTVHMLEAARSVKSVRAIVNVTTDKCYENKEWLWGYRENEAMGGYDPYSSSKGAAELVTSAYRQSFFRNGGVALASARAGNVIGGGDWATDRLIPDILRAFERDGCVTIRNPDAIRPWQHVLEPLSGYLALAEKLYTEGQPWAEGWNFGPSDDDARSVHWIVDQMVAKWGEGARWELDVDAHQPHEAKYLKLDISKAKSRLGWSPRWDLATALGHILTWHRAWLARGDVRELCVAQIENYQAS